MTEDQQFLYQVASDPKKTAKLMKIYAELKADIAVCSGLFFVVGLLIGYWAR